MDLIKKVNYIFDTVTKRKIIILFLIIVFGAFIELLGVAMILPIVNLALNPGEMEDELIYIILKIFWKDINNKQILICLLLIIIVVYILKNIYLAWMNSLIYHFTMNVKRKLATRLMSVYMRQPYSFFLKRNSSEIIRSVNTDTDNFYEVVSNCLLTLSNGLLTICLIIYLAVTNFWMTIMVGVMLVLCVLTVFLKIRVKTRKLGVEKQHMGAKIIQYLQQSFEGIKEIKILNKEEYFISEYDSAYSEISNITRKFNLYNVLPKFLIETIVIIAIMGFMLINVILNGNYLQVVPQLAVFATAAFRLLPSVNAIYAYTNTIIYNKASVDLVYHDIMEADAFEESNREEYPQNKNINFKNKIRIENMAFSYGKNKIFDNVNFTISIGTSVAFIGESGGGKTTLADLILGILTPDSGYIKSDETNIFENIQSWHKRLGYIPQNIYLTDSSIRENVALGIGNESIDDERVWEALEKAQLKEEVKKLKDDIYSGIGERGTRLSGGQRQRLGIARALYHDPEILVLDEATSALDNNTEQEVMKAINVLHGKKTIIIIAHRLSTIEKCDIIYKVGNKEVMDVTNEYKNAKLV